MPCTPEELDQLADLISRGKLGETAAISVDLPVPVQDPAIVETNRKMGIMANLRTQRGAMGDEFAVRAIDPLTQADIRGNNFKAKEYKNFMDAIEPLGLSEGFTKKWKTRLWGIPDDVSITLGKALELTDRDGFFMGPAGSFEPKYITAAQNVRKIYNRLFDEYKIDPDTYIRGYLPHRIARPDGIFWKTNDTPAEVAFKSKLTPDQVIFYHELERKGVMTEYDLRATTTFLNYVNGLAKAKILRPEIENLEKTYVNEFFGFKMYRGPEGNMIPMANDAVGYTYWRELVHNMFGGTTEQDKRMTHSLQTLSRMMGFDVDTKSTYRISQALSSLHYSGAMGLRPASIIRQFTQLVPTFAVLGGKHTMIGMQRAMQPDAIKGLIEKNMLSSPIENLIEAVGIQRGVGRVINETTEQTLKLFGAADRFVRATTAFAAESKFDDAIARGGTAALKSLNIRRDLKDEVLRLAESNLDAAKDRYVFSTLADLQYSYGRANRPAAFRGALGNLTGMFLSYPLNTFEMVRLLGKEVLPASLGGANNPMPIAKLLFISGAMITAGSEFLNADLQSATLLGAMPYSMAFPKMAMDTWNMGKTNLEWMTGNLFGMGTTDYHKYQQAEANKNFAKNLRMLMPGGLMFTEDVPRAIDEGSLVRMMALKPKPAAINEQNRLKRIERAAESRESAGLEGMSSSLPTLKSTLKSTTR